ncbi:hypothetical protein HDF17_002955 [Granulicella arctica]|uniref:Uncharacterized protein n=1 Tax=Granulicella arctica TaxID=940613 RepID=A0A7Y9TI57_9BACT|nr:hypothetical protein [Granulicella arctica]
MKALRIHEYGGVLQLDEIEQPTAGAGQVAQAAPVRIVTTSKRLSLCLRGRWK